MEFREELIRFAGICRIAKGMKNFHIGAINVRTTVFKTVRFDEIALQNNGINPDTFDLNDIFGRMEKIDDGQISKMKEKILAVAGFERYPEEKLKKWRLFRRHWRI